MARIINDWDWSYLATWAASDEPSKLLKDLEVMANNSSTPAPTPVATSTSNYTPTYYTPIYTYGSASATPTPTPTLTPAMRDKATTTVSTPSVAESDAAEKAKITNATAMAQASNISSPATITPTALAAGESGSIGATSIATQMAAQAASAGATPGSVADWRMGEEASMGAPKPPTTVSTTASTTESTQEPSTFPVAGTILRYKKSRAGYRIPVIADGKGGEYDGKEEVDPDYKDPNNANNGNIQFVAYEYNEDFTKRRAKFFNTVSGQFTYGEWEDNPKTKEQYDAEQAAKAAAAAAQQQKADAFALIEATMRSYGFNEQELKEIIDFIQGGLTNPQMGPNQLALALRQLGAYKTRFAGNQTREALGLNSLSEAEYLQQESDYSATFRQYGLQRFATRSQFANLIGNDVSNVELGKRVNMAVQRVQYGDPAVLKQLRTYYNITDTDIAAYYLNPKEVLPELEAKTTTAEIGATAASFGLSAEKARAEGLRAAGVDLTRARAGYETISGLLPRTQELTQFYAPSGIEYTQTTAEEEQFKGTASAKRARERLKELETGSFSGSSGRGLLGTRTSAGLI